MAKDTATKKRKASTSEAGVEKVPKMKKTPTETLERPARKRRATEDPAPPKPKKSKKPTKESIEDEEFSAEPVKETKGATKSVKKSKKASKVEPGPVEEVNFIEDEPEELGAFPEEDEDSEVDDQTEALLEGFQSDGDEEDALKEGSFPAGQEVPARKEVSKKQEKALKKIADAKDKDEKPGVIYLGRIPHGFYENEMKAYFKQFGNILKIRLSRNKKTGASKHHAWIQFESATVAEIVAKTMDNYLMFGHILKVKIVPDEQVPEDLFKGANKRFKKVPWNKMEGRKLEQGRSEEAWNKRVEKEQTRRDNRAAKSKAIGYEFDAPVVKSAKNVAVNDKKLEAAPEPLTIEAAPTVEETSKPKKEKKVKAKVAPEPPKEVEVAAEKPKKEKKAVAKVAPESKASEVAEVAEVKPKAKKNKKQTSIA